MKYLVEIIYTKGLTPTYKYYNNMDTLLNDITKTVNIESLEVYSLDMRKTELVTKVAIKKNNKE